MCVSADAGEATQVGHGKDFRDTVALLITAAPVYCQVRIRDTPEQCIAIQPQKKFDLNRKQSYKPVHL